MGAKIFDFPVPSELIKRPDARIFGIMIYGDDWVVEFVNNNNRGNKEGNAKIHRVKSHITGDRSDDVDTLHKLLKSKMSYHFPDAIVKEVSAKVSNFVDSLYENGAAHAIERVKKNKTQSMPS